MHILIVDDEPLARRRLRSLLAECASHAAPHTLSEAAHAAEALLVLRSRQPAPVDCVLLDIHMPGLSGLALAQQLHSLPQPPAVVFVTAHPDYAVSAFELDAVDYLTKPVRRERLQQALAKVQRLRQPIAATPAAPPAAADNEALLIQDRGRTERVPLAEVLYCRAEQKYITVRTAQRSYILDAALTDLEARYGARFLRIHRSVLVARHAMRALEKHHDPEEGEGWAVRLQGVAEPLPVSRRQLASVREALRG